MRTPGVLFFRHSIDMDSSSGVRAPRLRRVSTGGNCVNFTSWMRDYTTKCTALAASRTRLRHGYVGSWKPSLRLQCGFELGTRHDHRTDHSTDHLYYNRISVPASMFETMKCMYRFSCTRQKSADARNLELDSACNPVERRERGDVLRVTVDGRRLVRSVLAIRSLRSTLESRPAGRGRDTCTKRQL